MDFRHKSPRRLSWGATRRDISGVCDDCMNFLNHQNNQIIDVFLWKLSSALLHFNASQRDSDWGTDSAEQDFDTVCEKFITASVTQCPVPEVIYSLRAFDILQTAALWVGAFFFFSYGNEVGIFCLYNQRFQHRSPLSHFCFSFVHQDMIMIW